MLTRQVTDSLFDSYYESSLADQGFAVIPEKEPSQPTRPTHIQRALSASSSGSSSSDYSTESNSSAYSSRGPESPPDFPQRHQRQGSGSEGGADRRRIAVVQLDQVYPSTTSQFKDLASPLKTRRGLEDALSGLVLVPPPDIELKSILAPDPPSSAPPTRIPPEYREADSKVDHKVHHRSTSDIAGSRMRNAAVIGTGDGRIAPTILESPSDLQTNGPSALQPPVFLLPQISSPSAESLSRSVEDLPRADLVPRTKMDPSSGSNSHQSTEVSSRVTSPSKSQDVETSVKKFLNYKPGEHATAGPLPEPPRPSAFITPNTPPPPRPPRLHSPPPTSRSTDIAALKQTLQLSTAVSPKFKPSADAVEHPSDQDSRPSHSVMSPSTQHHAEASNSKTTSHIREGAFTPYSQASDSISSSATQDSPPLTSPHHSRLPATATQPSNPVNTMVQIEVHSPTTPMKAPSSVREETWVSVNRDLTSSPEGRTSAEISVSSHGHQSDHSAPSPPPKSPRAALRRSLTNGFRRMSLHRSPSRRSLTRSSSIGHSGSGHSGSPRQRSPSPPDVPPIPKLPPRKIKTLYPAAMYCHEVYSQRTTQERCIIYAQKINDLYISDCGLSDFIVEARFKRVMKHNDSSNGNSAPSIPSMMVFSPQPRVTSQSSVQTEVTFPRRPDATKATDLTGLTEENFETANPIVLPYPALATPNQRSLKFTGSGQLAASSIKTLPIGSSPKPSFFASLGRKASLNRGGKSSSVPATPPARLTKNPPPSVMSSRMPGGPRPPGNRVAKSQTLIISPNPSSMSDGLAPLNRSPSVNPSPSPERHTAAPTDPDFLRQVDKLADLIPHADRAVLTGYLRRSGDPMLAIGQYLEDEKNRSLKDP